MHCAIYTVVINFCNVVRAALGMMLPLFHGDPTAHNLSERHLVLQSLLATVIATKKLTLLCFCDMHLART